MQSEDAKFIKKRFKGGIIEPHPSEPSIIVNYKLEAAVYGERDIADPMLADKKDCQRIIRLKTLNSKTDVAALAREVVDKCDLIHKSQLSDVEQIIYFLKNRKVSRDSGGSTLKSASVRSKSEARILDKVNNETDKASIRNIDDYIELLYEELPERIRGSAYILQLARNPDNLEELEKNEAVLSALSRVLREDWRKSLDLSTNIIYTFFCFSTYTHFHSVIVQYKIGSLCMDVIDHELKRYDQMKQDLERRKNAENGNNKDINKSQDNNLDGTIMNVEKPKEMEPPRRRIPELKQRPKSGNWSMASSMTSSASSSSLLKAYSMNNSYHEGLSKELQNSSVGNSTEDLKNDPKRQKDEIDKLNKQLKTFAKKQEQLLRVAFYLLLNIAENTKLEEKMRRKNIIKMLVKALERQNIDLLVLIVTFLKKLSIVRDNKDEMKELNVVEKLPRLLHSSHSDLIQATLKLIFNLSFDGQLRAKMVRIGLLPKLIQFMSDDKHHSIVIKILYHFSLDDKVKAIFTYTDCVPLLTDMLLLNLNKKSDIDLIALGINLALNKKCAQKMCENNRLKDLIERTFKYRDATMMKMIRNISSHEELRNEFLDFVDDFAKTINECDDEDFLVECIGVLGNMILPELDYSQILQAHNLIPWIRKTLIPGNAKDDIVLDTVVFLSTCATNDELCAMLLCKAEVILSLIELLKAKQEDDEMVLQIVYVFQQVLRNESTRNYMIKETESPAYLIDLMHDKNIEIRKVCDFCLDIIAMTDPNWASRIKLEKFRNHNSQWLTMVETQEADDIQDYGTVEDEDGDLPVYLTSDYLTQIYQSGESNDDSGDARTPSNSSFSRPMSRYSKDFEDFDILKSSQSQEIIEPFPVN
ncbi:hypothetical protein PVAND_011210 [Polypedilum vanderplanki]|uniref:Kinesin-associated protein 3 n=1 Tax=Polypedilum vanderplanki TaxID=319348 RepID=A0A9J6CHW2_POLVA|nr:hypothetical protein PVAND_011210 [Polypedilum vanderplanki]